MHPKQFECLYLCLKAGNEVNLMARSKSGEAVRVFHARKAFEKRGERATHGIKVLVEIAGGEWVQLISGDVLRTSGKYGYEWKM